jgi:hypothetical protein
MVADEVLVQPQRFLEECFARWPIWEAYGQRGAGKSGLNAREAARKHCQKAIAVLARCLNSRDEKVRIIAARIDGE